MGHVKLRFIGLSVKVMEDNDFLSNDTYPKKARYIGKDCVTYEKGKIYAVIGKDRNIFRVMSELDEDYLLPSKVIQFIEK